MNQTDQPTQETPWKITRESFEVMKNADPIAGEVVDRYIDDGRIVIVERVE